MNVTHSKKTLVTLDEGEIADMIRRAVREKVAASLTLDYADISVRFTNDNDGELAGAVVTWEEITEEHEDE